jgi:hypothetical protein
MLTPTQTNDNTENYVVLLNKLYPFSKETTYAIFP